MKTTQEKLNKVVSLIEVLANNPLTRAKIETLIKDRISPNKDGVLCADLEAKEISAVIRCLLKETWKFQKFSVRTDAGSIRVSWVDGPTTEQVDELVGLFQGAYFDHYSDSRLTKDPLAFEMSNGTEVLLKLWSQYLFTSREMDFFTEQKLVRRIEKERGEAFDPRKLYDFYWSKEVGFVEGEMLPYSYGNSILHSMFDSVDFYATRKR